MTIEEATKTLEASLKVSIPNFHQDARDAVKLGIEALNRIKDLRDRGEPCIYIPLPGETRSPNSSNPTNSAN